MATVILESTTLRFRTFRSLLLYRVIQLFCSPAIFLYLLFRLFTDARYWDGFAERFGFVRISSERTGKPSIWIHAVSVGEVASAIPLLRKLRAAAPNTPLYLSTTTVAGKRAASAKAGNLADGIFYAPLDFASAVRRFLRSAQPAAVVVLETEIWPNLYFESKRVGCCLAIVNARISDRTWPRYYQLRAFFTPVISLADFIVPQSAADADRYRRLGVHPAKLRPPKNLKYDAAQAPTPVALNTFGAQQVIVAASTVGPNEKGSIRKHNIDEDEILINAFREIVEQLPNSLLILAPRQPSRFDQVAAMLSRSGFAFLRRSDRQFSHSFHCPGIVLLDTIGELAGVYQSADIAFVGGSLAPRGGHNILEPAAAGVPVVVGPHTHNFRAIVDDFIAADALVQVGRGADLAHEMLALLRDGERRQDLGQKGQRLVQSNKGAAAEICSTLVPLFFTARRLKPRSYVTEAIVRSLAHMWTLGGFRKRIAGERLARKRTPLHVPVISVGAITVGGAGKTPLTDHLTRTVAALGYTPGIVTRGYKRRSADRVIVLPKASCVPAAITGDEAQIYLRSGVSSVAIAADRYEAARLLLNQVPATDVLFLDDGFQHARFCRDLDIVVIDGLDPFGGEATVPYGRLREPLDALARANAFVITRCDDGAAFRFICNRLTALNPKAPVLRSDLVRMGWRSWPSEHPVKIRDRKVAAFCGLGNPQNFWNTVEDEGGVVVYRWAFPDHHLYHAHELRRVAEQAKQNGAEFLLTTEKDCMNLPSGVFETFLGDLPLLWLEIGTKLDDEATLLTLIKQAIAAKRGRR